MEQVFDYKSIDKTEWERVISLYLGASTTTGSTVAFRKVDSDYVNVHSSSPDIFQFNRIVVRHYSDLTISEANILIELELGEMDVIDESERRERVLSLLVEDETFMVSTYQAHQFLCSKGFLVPLFFGQDHIHNRKNLIQINAGKYIGQKN